MLLVCSVGDLALVVGPPGGEGVALSLRRQGSKTDVNGTLHVGAQTGITGAVVHTLSSKSALRAGVKLGTMGLELDLGGSRRISYGSTGMSVTIGIQVGDTFYVLQECRNSFPIAPWIYRLITWIFF
jgi:hypothetical protein